MGVTTHYINELVDAGNQISFDELKLNAYDRVEDVINNMYYLQIDALKSFLIKYRENSICSVPIFREYKNAPMGGKIFKFA